MALTAPAGAPRGNERVAFRFGRREASIAGPTRPPPRSVGLHEALQDIQPPVLGPEDGHVFVNLENRRAGNGPICVDYDDLSLVGMKVGHTDMEMVVTQYSSSTHTSTVTVTRMENEEGHTQTTTSTDSTNIVQGVLLQTIAVHTPLRVIAIGGEMSADSLGRITFRYSDVRARWPD